MASQPAVDEVDIMHIRCTFPSAYVQLRNNAMLNAKSRIVIDVCWYALTTLNSALFALISAPGSTDSLFPHYPDRSVQCGMITRTWGKVWCGVKDLFILIFNHINKI